MIVASARQWSLPTPMGNGRDFIYIHTYHWHFNPESSKDISDIPPRHQHFTISTIDSYEQYFRFDRW
jgi:nitrate reductase alpha subunit